MCAAMADEYSLMAGNEMVRARKEE